MYAPRENWMNSIRESFDMKKNSLSICSSMLLLPNLSPDLAAAAETFCKLSWSKNPFEEVVMNVGECLRLGFRRAHWNFIFILLLVILLRLVIILTMALAIRLLNQRISIHRSKN